METGKIEEVFYRLSGLLHEHQADVSDVHFIIKVDRPRTAAMIERMFHEWMAKHPFYSSNPWSWPSAIEMYGIKIEFLLDYK
jgi:hypothetical protein